MSSRLIAVFVLSALIGSASLSAQETAAKADAVKVDPADAIKADLATYLEKADETRAIGRSIAKYLRRGAAKHKEVEFILHELKKQARKNRKRSKLEEAELVKNVGAFAAAAKTLVAHDSKLLPIIEPMIASSVAEAKKLEAAQEAAEAAAKAKPDDADLAKAAKDAATPALAASMHSKVLERAAEAVFVGKARRAFLKFAGKGTFDGMYNDLRNHQPRMLGAFMTIFLNRDDDSNDRNLAAEGVAQFATKGEKEILTRLADVESDVSERPEIRESAMKVMARLGDRGPLNKLLGTLQSQIAAEQAKPQEQMNVFAILSLQNRIAFMLHVIGDYKMALGQYLNTGFAATNLPYDQLNDQAKGFFASVFYNCACAASRVENSEIAVWALNQHYNFGGNLGDWPLEDGDLEYARRDKAFAAAMKTWRDGKKPGSFEFDREAMMKTVQSLFGPPPGQEGEAGSADDSGDAGDAKSSTKN